MSTTKPNTKQAAEAREAGNTAYKKGKWVEAIGHYTTAAVLAPQDPAPLLNRAQAYLKIQKWQDCERDCSKVLGWTGQAENVKALYRRALARKERKLFEEARNDLEVLLKVEPANAAAKEELSELKKAIKSAKKSTAPKKAPQDISSFTELTTKRTSAGTSNLPGRNRSSAVRIPIKVVPRFTTRVSAGETNGETSASGGSRGKEAVTGTGSKPTATQEAPTSASAFASSKASRSAKSSHISAETTVSPKPAPERSSTDVAAAALPVVRPPATGLDLVDRLEGLAGDDEQRWRFLQSVPPSKLTALLGGILEPDHLATIYATLSAYHQRSGTSVSGLVREYLEALRRIPRWQMTESLLLPGERKVGQALWSAVCP